MHTTARTHTPASGKSPDTPRSSIGRNAEAVLLDRLPPVNFILAVLIILRHSNINIDHGAYPPEYVYAYNDFSWALRRFVFNFTEIAVPLFFFFSAMLFYRTYDNSRAVYTRKMRSRVWSLLVPYLIFRTVGYVIKVAKGVYVLNAGGYAVFILKHTYTALWFLPELFILAALAPVLWPMVRRTWLFAVVMCATVAVDVFCFRDQRDYGTFVYWLPVYLLGAYVGASGLMKRVTVNFRSWHLWLYLAFIVAVWLLPNPLPYNSPAINLAFAVMRLVCIPVSVLLFVTMPQIGFRSFFTFSFFMYCCHDFVVTEIVEFSHRHGWSDLVEFAAASTVAIVVTVALAYALRRFAPPIWHILNGRR